MTSETQGSTLQQFDSAARQILVLAYDLAIFSGHGVVEPEHILVALATSSGSGIFSGLGGQVEALRRGLGKLKVDTTKYPPGATLSNDSRALLQQALTTARKRGEALISPTHLLMATVEQPRPGVRALLIEAGMIPAVLVRLGAADKPLSAASANLTPAEKMGKFTQRARLVMKMAQDETAARQHRLIEPEHLLLALVLEEGGIGGKVLREASISAERLKTLLDEMHLETAAPQPNLELSEHTKRALELTVAFANTWKHDYIDTGHLLVALVQQARPGVVTMLSTGSQTPAAMMASVQSLAFRPKE